MKFFTKSLLWDDVSTVRIIENASRANTVNDSDIFDIFLSHSYSDKQYIHKLKTILEQQHKLKCYVDWISEPSRLPRDKIDNSTANILRKRMRQCKSLIFCTSTTSSDSKWMPWELGYFDAYKGAVAILPIVDEGKDFIGQEYLGLYPLIDRMDHCIWVNTSSKFMNLREWINIQNQ